MLLWFCYRCATYFCFNSSRWHWRSCWSPKPHPASFIWGYILVLFIIMDTGTHWPGTVYPMKYAHGFVVLCFVVVMQSFIMNSNEVFIHIHQGCFAGTGAIVRLPQCQWSKPDGYGKISQCITTTKHSKAKTVCIFFGIYCIWNISMWMTRTHTPCLFSTTIRGYPAKGDISAMRKHGG